MSFDPATFKVTKELKRDDILLSIVRLEGSQRVFAGSSDSKIYEFNFADENASGIVRSGHSSYVTGLALSEDRLISGGYDGQLIWWNLNNAEQIRILKAHDRWIRKVRVSPDAKLVATVADDMVCRLWDADSGDLKHELRGHAGETPQQFSSMLYVCAFSPDGHHVATADRIGHVIVWDVRSGKAAAAMDAPELYTWDDRQRIRSIGGARSLAFSPDGTLLAVGGIGQVQNVDGLGGKARVELFEWARGQRVAEFVADQVKGLVEHLHFDPDGQWLLGMGGDNKGLMIAIDIHSKKVAHEETAPMHVHDFVLNEQGTTLYAAGHHLLARFEASEV